MRNAIPPAPRRARAAPDRVGPDRVMRDRGRARVAAGLAATGTPCSAGHDGVGTDAHPVAAAPDAAVGGESQPHDRRDRRRHRQDHDQPPVVGGPGRRARPGRGGDPAVLLAWARRTAAALLAAGIGLLVAGVGATPASAAAQPIEACTTTSGVILAVDFAHWGGPLLRACGTTPTTGYQLLNQGGWHTTGDSHDGPGFICRIGYAGYHGGTSYPTPQEQACIVTPPSSASWAYWYAGAGQHTWSYSPLGAMSQQPEPGSVELWTFGGTDVGGTTGSGVPAFRPDSLRARNTSPVGQISTRPPTRGPTAHPGGGSAGPATTPSPRGTGPIGTPSRSPAGAPPIVDVGPAVPPARATRAGSATPTVVTLVVAVLLGAAGITLALRRRSRGGA